MGLSTSMADLCCATLYPTMYANFAIFRNFFRNCFFFRFKDNIVDPRSLVARKGADADHALVLAQEGFGTPGVLADILDSPESRTIDVETSFRIVRQIGNREGEAYTRVAFGVDARSPADELEQIPGVIPPQCPPDCKHVYWFYAVRFDPRAAGIDANRIIPGFNLGPQIFQQQ